jgi:hypothetical protein
MAPVQSIAATRPEALTSPLPRRLGDELGPLLRPYKNDMTEATTADIRKAIDLLNTFHDPITFEDISSLRSAEQEIHRVFKSNRPDEGQNPNLGVLFGVLEDRARLTPEARAFAHWNFEYYRDYRSTDDQKFDYWLPLDYFLDQEGSAIQGFVEYDIGRGYQDRSQLTGESFEKLKGLTYHGRPIWPDKSVQATLLRLAEDLNRVGVFGTDEHDQDESLKAEFNLWVRTVTTDDAYSQDPEAEAQE